MTMKIYNLTFIKLKGEYIMANLEELKKVAEENGIELTEDMLDGIAGGVIDPEIWNNMSEEERKAAQIQSMLRIAQKLPCDLQ